MNPEKINGQPKENEGQIEEEFNPEISQIPDLSGLAEKLLEVEVSTNPGISEKYGDEILVKTQNRAMEMRGRLKKVRQSPLIDHLRTAIANVKRKFGEAPVIPEAESLLEIGGPTYGTSENDLFYSKVSKAIYANPSKNMIGGAAYGYDIKDLWEEERELCNQNLKINECALPVEDVEQLVPEYGKFDYVTSYGVFGSENVNTPQWEPDTGADLTTAEKRKNVLGHIASCMKVNGLFLIRLIDSPVKNPNDKNLEWGLSKEESERYLSKKAESAFGDIPPEPGFTVEELEEAGFAVISKRPYYDNCYAFQYKGSKNS